jgi:hypothetical protein
MRFPKSNATINKQGIVSGAWLLSDRQRGRMGQSIALTYDEGRKRVSPIQVSIYITT